MGVMLGQQSLDKNRPSSFLAQDGEKPSRLCGTIAPRRAKGLGFFGRTNTQPNPRSTRFPKAMGKWSLAWPLRSP